MTANPVEFSFEFFPPAKAEALLALESAYCALSGLNPVFFSITYGAGGSTRARSLELVRQMAAKTKVPLAAHLTCVGASRGETDAILSAYEALGVRHIVALRGDSPDGIGKPFIAHPQGYQDSVALIAAIAKRGAYCISVSAYPERHPESRSMGADIDWLKAKWQAGATQAITQFFFDNSHFYRLREAMAQRGIGMPLIPGLILAENFSQVATFAHKAGASVPDAFAQKFVGLEDDPPQRRMVASAHVRAQLEDLLSNGVRHVHFYTLNRAEALMPLALEFCQGAADGA